MGSQIVQLCICMQSAVNTNINSDDVPGKFVPTKIFPCALPKRCLHCHA